MAFETERFEKGFGLAAGAVTFNLVGALFDGARQHREATERVRIAQVARQNRSAAVAAQARVGVLRVTTADLRARLAEADDLVEELADDNRTLRAEVAALRELVAELS